MILWNVSNKDLHRTHSDHNKGNDHETSNGPTFVSVKIEVVNLQVWVKGSNLMGDKIAHSCLLVCLLVGWLVGWFVSVPKGFIHSP